MIRPTPFDHAILDKREGRIIASLMAASRMPASPSMKAELRNQAKAEFVEIDRLRKALLEKAKS